MSGIYDYIDLDEPKVIPQAKVGHPTKDKTVGLVGVVPTRDEARGYVSHRRREGPEKGYFEKHEGYCITDSILRRLQRHDVKFVYIVETDTGDVLEYNINSFNGGIPVDEGEAQHCAPEEQAMKVWEDYREDLIQTQ